MLAVSRLLGLLMVLLLAYTLGMIGAYSIPDEWVEENVHAASSIVVEESNMLGGYATYFWHNGFGITDNVTDKVIFEGLLRGERSVMDAAMRTDYARYWHGYAALLRPLMTVLSIINIRYLNMMLMFGLFLFCFAYCREKLGTWMAFAFGAGLLMTFILIALFCQQYCPVYLITLAVCFVLLRFWKGISKHLPELFLITGSLVCFFDFLTFPVLALGYPLLLCLMLGRKDGKPTKTLWLELFWFSAVWMAGYALTWFGKAVIGSLLTEQNVIGDVLSQVAFRTAGDYGTDSGPKKVTIAIAVGKNLETFFMGSNAVFFLVLLAVYGLRLLRRKLTAAGLMSALPVAAVALYPFVWYCVLQNHVRMHFWMTNKMLAVTVFAALAALAAATEPGREEDSRA